MPGLGRLKSPDPRDLRFPMQAHLPPAPVRRVQCWIPGPTLNQGDTPSCVGHAWRNWLNCSPIPDPPQSGPSAMDIYAAAQAVDGFQHTLPLPDNHDDTGGSSVRAGAQVMQRLGYLKEYVWAFDVQTAAAWVLDHGPVVCGVNWYAGFDNPDAQGFVKATGTVRGGHAFLWVAYSAVTGHGVFQQQWGEWGDKLLPTRRHTGFFRMDTETMDRLIREDGEICTAAEVSRPAASQNRT